MSTTACSLLGTPRYMAPEQVAQNSKITGATDLYSLGLVAYRLLVGESYYRGPVMGVLAELLHGVTSAPSTRHPQLGAEFDAWFLQACHRDPACRFGSASQQIEALATVLGLPSTVSVGEPAASSAAVARRHPLAQRQLVALGGAALALVAAASAHQTLSHRDAASNAPSEREGTTTPRAEAPPAEGMLYEPLPPQPVQHEALPAPTPLPNSPVSRRKLSKARVNISSAQGKPPAALDPYQDQK